MQNLRDRLGSARSEIIAATSIVNLYATNTSFLKALLTLKLWVERRRSV